MKKFFLFVVLARAMAAILITNSHYAGVYPNDIFAHGGLLGDVLFFAISGFCLANTSVRFDKWYLKRILRIYIPVWVCTIIYIIAGAFEITTPVDIVKYFVYPSKWHFVASIMVLYIPLFFVSKYIMMNPKNYGILSSVVFLIQMLIYLTFYDRSYYHIDEVLEPMIEFLFFQSMLFGMHCRWRYDNGYTTAIGGGKLLIITVLLTAVYFASKLVFLRFSIYSAFQIFNQIALFALLFALFNLLMKLESLLDRFSNRNIWKAVSFLAEHTLEIYLVQQVIINHLRIGPFPINWLILTCSILVAAFLLSWISNRTIKLINRSFHIV